MGHIKWLVLILIIILFQECQSPRKSIIRGLQQIHPEIPTGKWKIQQHYAFDSLEHLLIHSYKKDTFYDVNFEQISSKKNKKTYQNVYLKKIFYDSVNKHVVLINKGILYYYISPVVDSSKKTFIRGKYYFNFSHPGELEGFRACEIDFYLENSDSLNKILGNEIQSLPCVYDTTHIE